MNENLEFQSFNKLARLNREIVITEKLDGTNAQILIVPTTELNAGSSYPDATYVGDFSEPGSVAIFAGSRNRWITPGNDNYGFAGWVRANAEELKKLGPGRHFGEWWGNGIQRNYGLKTKRFSLFNVARWVSNWNSSHTPGVMSQNASGECNPGPACCHVVPTLGRGMMSTHNIDVGLRRLRATGSAAAPGFLDPEGIVIYHTAAKTLFKVTLKNDDKPKSLV